MINRVQRRFLMSGTKYDYDYVVIGGGSAGVRSSRIAAQHGAKTALIETAMTHGPPTYSAIGGTCVNVGCVPKKLFVYASRCNENLHVAKEYGWDIEKKGFNFQDFIKAKDKEISRLNGIYGRILKNSGDDGGVKIIQGLGKFVDNHTIEIDPVPGVKDSDNEEVLTGKRTITADKILICTGGWPFKPEIKGIEHAITSNELFYLKEQPKKLLIVGGGFIACEFACVFNNLGTKVTQMYRGSMILRNFDLGARTHILKEMELAGINMDLNTNPKIITKLANGKFDVECEDGMHGEYDVVCYATGRRPNVDKLNLDKIGVKLGKGGEVMVNKYNQTNIDNIYAAGDVTDRVQLTPVALREGHYLADNLFQKENGKLLRGSQKEYKTVNYEFIPSAVFTTPELGTCGYTEEEAAKKFQNITVYVSNYKPLMFTVTDVQSREYIKLIVDDATDKIVGFHMIGHSAAEITQGLAIGMLAGMTKKQADDTIGLHPSSAEEIVTMRTPSYKYKNGEKCAKL